MMAAQAQSGNRAARTPDLSQARRAQVGSREVWAAPSADGQWVCAATTGTISMGSCGPASTFNDSGPGIIMTLHPAPNAPEPVHVVGVVADNVTEVVLHLASGVKRRLAPTNNVVWFQTFEIPVAADVIRPGNQTVHTDFQEVE
jgi:hypothetical protein